MIIRKSQLLRVLLPLMFVFTIAQGVTFLSDLITPRTRFFFLSFAAAYVLKRGGFVRNIGRERSVILWLSINFVWIVSTIMWSEDVALSTFKSILFIYVSIGMPAVAYEWVRCFSWRRGFDFLSWLFVIVILSSFGGRSVRIADLGVSMYGQTGNPNTFGMLQFMMIPLVVWYIYTNWNQHQIKRYAGLLVLSFVMYNLLSSYSRAMMLGALVMLFFFLLSVEFNKKRMAVILMLCLSGLLIVMSSTNVINSILSRYVYKGNQDPFQSRRYVWDKSIEGAQKGGWMGVGYGVATGAEKLSLSKFTGLAPGREKGSSQLAILEETGKLGLCFYGIFLCFYFSNFFRFYLRLKGPPRVMLGLILGAMLGLLAESIFEGWWTAPLAPESIYFWTFFGLSYGLKHQIQKENRREHLNVEASPIQAV